VAILRLPPLYSLSTFIPKPFPLFQVKVLPDGDSLDPSEGELLVRSGGLFTSYWRRPDATLGAFDDEGYFRTGDKVREEEGGFRILGRLSVDIIKSGGYKLSALEIETELLKVRAGQIQFRNKCRTVNAPFLVDRLVGLSHRLFGV
jgi:acyl-CoA synthetase (AMP-forming)/AMP-acid ligase II